MKTALALNNKDPLVWEIGLKKKTFFIIYICIAAKFNNRQSIFSMYSEKIHYILNNVIIDTNVYT